MKTPFNITLPQGVRDILPDEARRISNAAGVIMAVFESHGFGRVMTPLIEYVDVLSLGLGESLKERVLKFVDPSTGRIVALRPDITPQIARVAATRMKDMPLPLKLCYLENVLRYDEPRDGRSKELLQAGAEMITSAVEPEIDAGMIVMAIEALLGLGLRDFKIDIGDVSFLKIVLDRLGLAPEQRKAIERAVAIKDASTLESALNDASVVGGDKSLLISLTTLYGEHEVVGKACDLVKGNLELKVLDNLNKILDLIDAKGFKEYVTVDLGEVRGADYYTGVIFEGFASGVGKPILIGGRYDNLIERFGYKAAATGFAFDMENTVSAMERI